MLYTLRAIVEGLREGWREGEPPDPAPPASGDAGSGPHLPSNPLGTSIDAIARRYYRAEMAKKRLGVKGWASIGCFSPLLFIVAYMSEPLAAGMLFFWILTLPASYLRSATRVSRKLARFRAGDAATVLPVYRLAVEEYRRHIAAHRASALGGSSEWSIARNALGAKMTEARGQVEYWQGRLRMEPDNRLAVRQLKRAREIRVKLGSALRRVDDRGNALRRFYAECRERVRQMERFNRDLAETLRLDRLAAHVAVHLGEAEIAPAAIARRFVAEADAVGRALGGLERVQVKTLAGEAHLDDIEYLADRINESSDAERRMIEDLERELHQV